MAGLAVRRLAYFRAGVVAGTGAGAEAGMPVVSGGGASSAGVAARFLRLLRSNSSTVHCGARIALLWASPGCALPAGTFGFIVYSLLPLLTLTSVTRPPSFFSVMRAASGLGAGGAVPIRPSLVFGASASTSSVCDEGGEGGVVAGCC